MGLSPECGGTAGKEEECVCVGVIWGEGCFLSVLTYLNIFKIQVTDNSCILHGLHVIFKFYLKS